MRLIVTLALAMLVGGIAGAADLSPKPQGTEVTFVTSVQSDLMHRFPKAADALRSGYFRFTDEDDTGAISYASLQWTSSDPQHPSQLWYDVHGNLLGADFSVPYTTKPPRLWGVNPLRWSRFHEHMHWVVHVNGRETYDATSAKKFEKAGGDPDHPRAATVVKLGGAKNTSQVIRVFQFPNIWDLEVWVKPNPKGAFADTNPLVKPSKKASS